MFFFNFYNQKLKKMEILKNNSYDCKLIDTIFEIEKDKEFLNIGFDNKEEKCLDVEFNKEYQFAFKAIKNNTLPDIKKLNKETLTNLVNGLMYFCNNKLLDDLLLKIAKEVREKYVNRKGVELFFEKINKPPSFVKKHFYGIKKINSSELLKNPNISEEFIKKYIINNQINDTDWSYLCENTNLSEQFFETYEKLGVLDWRSLCKNTNLSEEFFKIHIQKIKHESWFYLCKNPNMSEEFFETCNLKIFWESLCQNTNMSEEFFERHLLKGLKLNWKSLCLNTNISEKFFERHLDKISEKDCYSLCRNTNLSEAFFERHINNVIWSPLSRNTNMSEEFFERHINNIVWSSVCENTNLSEKFFERHLNKITEKDWYYLCRNTNLSEEFFERHLINSKTSNKIKNYYNHLFCNTFRVNHSQYKLICWLRKNPQFTFDRILEKYIFD